MSFLASNSFKKFHGKFKERAAKKKEEKRNSNTKEWLWLMPYLVLQGIMSKDQENRHGF